jgi:DNA-binding NarL/FixJ family response regulator
MKRARVLLADDHRMVAEGLKSLLSPEFDLVGLVEDGRALLEAARRLRPDVIVADITMPHLNGIEALVQLKQEDKRVRVVFLTMHQEAAYARRALEAGASGFVLKHSAPAELVTAIHAALEGKTYLTPSVAGGVLQAMQGQLDKAGDPVASLTPRQREILQLLAEGRSAKEIAATIQISTRTVEFHKYQMMEKLDLHTNAELVHFAIKHGIVAI